MAASTTPSGSSSRHTQNATNNNNSSSNHKSASSPSTFAETHTFLVQALVTVCLLQILYLACVDAYRIRTKAIDEYGRIIHEFDPYFNYRATEYLWEHGWNRFSKWFDYLVWYPLGRPVGTTIYPGMQVTAVLLKQYLLPQMSINDICCFIPVWFGVLATLAVAWMTYECTAGPYFESGLNVLPGVSWGYQKMLRPLLELTTGRVILPLTGSTWGIMEPVYTRRSASTSSSSLTTPATMVAAACAVGSATIMSIVPAHLLRSVGGGYDNESIAVTAMVAVFASWCRALRDTTTPTGPKATAELSTNSSSSLSLMEYVLTYEQVHWYPVIWGAITGVAYFYMVAAWGGYVFVLNLVGVHATFLTVVGRYSSKLHRAYTAFFVLGTLLAIQVPVVGWTPLKNLEQLGPLLAVGGMQLIEYCEIVLRYRRFRFRTMSTANKSKKPGSSNNVGLPGVDGVSVVQAWLFRLQVFATAGLLAAGFAWIFLIPTGYFGPISSRVRGLFVEHTKTGNPLVDSVAEHQAASPEAYFQYLHNAVYLAPIGLAMTALVYFNDSSSFLLVYAVAAYFFSHRMVRLVLLTAPIASALGGIALGRFFSWSYYNLLPDSGIASASLVDVAKETDERAQDSLVEDTAKTDSTTSDTKKGKSKSTNAKKEKPSMASESIKGKMDGSAASTDEISNVASTTKSAPRVGDPLLVRLLRLLITAAVVFRVHPKYREFRTISNEMATHISHPTIIQKGQNRRTGETVLIDDYREAYHWLRDNTPLDARIMAWWDYGYQITGIANRTTIADGNTWNHEHIALLGRTLTAPEKEGHRIARHLADYVLVWAGGGGDDLAKSPHLRRIANSVYRGLCGEPTCRDFGYFSDGKPTRDMENSLLFKLVSHKIRPGVEIDPNRFREVYSSKYGKVRIYKIMSVSKESKEWVEANRQCDAPGSWFCPGTYPPSLQKILDEKKDFKQLEDFNVKDKGDDSEYQQQYFANLNKKSGGQRSRDRNVPVESEPRKKSPPLSPRDIDLLNEQWADNEMTTLMWEMTSQRRYEDLISVLREEPALAHIRSSDGRGPMWWAHESGDRRLIELFQRLGVSDSRTDENGMTPKEAAASKK